MSVFQFVLYQTNKIELALIAKKYTALYKEQMKHDQNIRVFNGFKGYYLMIGTQFCPLV